MYHATMAYTVALTCFSGPVQRRSDPQGSTKVFVRHVASCAAEEAGDIKPQQRCCRYIFIHMQICKHMQLYETSIASSCGGQVPCSLDRDPSRPSRHLRGGSGNGSTYGVSSAACSTGVLHEWPREVNQTGAEYRNGLHSYTQIAYYIL